MNTRAQMAKRYGAIADAYDRVWAPPLLAFARPLVDRLGPTADETIVDLGAGTGAIAAGLRSICLDRTEGMLAVAASKGLRAAVCDIRRLPLAPGSVDVALSTFVLQHVPTPGSVAAEARRVLRPGGRYGTATWSPVHGESGGVYALLASVFESVPAEASAMKTWHARVDAPEKMARFAKRAGFRDVSAWVEDVSYDWPVEHFFEWATTMGPYGRRFGTLPSEDQLHLSRRLREGLEGASAQDLRWTAPIVYCVATKT